MTEINNEFKNINNFKINVYIYIMKITSNV